MTAAARTLLLALALALLAGGARAQPGPSELDSGRQSPAALLDRAEQLHRREAAAIERGDYAAAIADGEAALALVTRGAGPASREAAREHDILGNAYDSASRVGPAIEHFQRALEIRERLSGAESPDVARTLAGLAGVYDTANDFRRSEPLHRRALAILEKTRGPDGRDVGVVLNNLGYCLERAHKSAEAVKVLERALAIFERIDGKSALSVAVVLANLGMADADAGRFDAGERRYDAALAIRRAQLGEAHPDTGIAEQELAGILRAKGDYAGALALLDRAEKSVTRTGAADRDVAVVLELRAWTLEAKGDRPGAVAAATRALAIEQGVYEDMIGAASDMELAWALAPLESEIDATISLALRSAPGDEAAAKLALSGAVLRGGLALDALGRTARLRVTGGAEDRAAVDALVTARAERSRRTIAFDGDGSDLATFKELADLDARIVELEGDVRRRTEKSVPRPPPTIEALRAALPAGTALVVVTGWRPFDARKPRGEDGWGQARYAAIVLRPDGSAASVDLGDAAELDAAVAPLRLALSDPARDPRAPARALDAKLFAPIVPALGGATRVVIAASGAPSLVPFGALVDDAGALRAERFSIAYVPSARDLLRPHAAPREGDVVVAAPAFGDAMPRPPAETASGAVRYRLWGFSRMRFAPLPGAAAEGAAVARSLPGARLLDGAAATEAALRALHGPRVLHVATHGFFLGGPASDAAGARGLALEPGGPSPAGMLDAPGDAGATTVRYGFGWRVRSGLALAGANAHPRAGAGDDGLLTAEEASGLDLVGTKLVVLSACDSGVGDVDAVEGVYGLRRALLLAGAETLMMSLWKVDDAATRDLMVDTYRRLAAGAGRADALRDAQRAMRADPARSHPYYWASFVAIGDTGPLAGGAVAPSAPPRVAPPPRGCTCEAPGAPPSSGSWLLLALAAVSGALRAAPRARRGSRRCG